jgi:2-desacetyl-2-hydroxyethyl bacteriochlorophyllide A dehydrogenase
MEASSMRAAVTRGPRRIEVERVARPEPRPGEVRVRVRACGLCGTDLHLHEAGLYPAGLVPGHEVAGEVERLGPGVDGLSLEQPVAIEPLLSCGRCAPCRAGRDSICPELRVLGLHVSGGFSESIVVPRRRVFPAAAELDPRIVALAEPTAVAIHGLRRGALEPGQRVLVLGAGAIGLLALLAARSLGASEVWVVARHPHQAALARSFGAARVLDGDDSTPESLAPLGRTAGIDLVVEAVGAGADTLRAALAAVRPGGTVSVLGVFLSPIALDPLPPLLKETNLVWSNCYAHPEQGADFEDALTLLAEQREAANRLVTHQVPLDEVDRAYTLASDKKAGVVKVNVVP